MLIPQLDPLTEQQLAWICSLQESSQQAEEALSQGLEQLQQSLTEIIAAGSLADDASAGDCMAQMALALSKLSDLRGFVHQVGPQLCNLSWPPSGLLKSQHASRSSVSSLIRLRCWPNVSFS